MQPNEVRGEFAIPLDGAEHIMRPTYEAIVAIERGTGRSLIALCNAARMPDLSVSTMSVIVGECVRAYGKAEKNRSHALLTDEAIGRCLIDMGPLVALRYLIDMLMLAATGGVDAEGKAKAPAETKGTETDPPTGSSATES